MSVPSYGEYVSLATLTDQANEGPVAIPGTPPLEPGFSWRVQAPKHVDTARIFLAGENMTRLLRITQVSGLIVESYVDDRALDDPAAVTQPLHRQGSRYGAIPEFFPEWTVGIDKVSTLRMLKDETEQPDHPKRSDESVWGAAIDGALRRALWQGVETDSRMHASALEIYMASPLIRAETDF